MTLNTPVISAKNVWKLFGPDPKRYLAKMKSGMDFNSIRDDGYIAGVKDVSIDVSRGVVLSRIRAAPSARLGHLTFECQGAFPSQC
jgi:hypothetical protein